MSTQPAKLEKVLYTAVASATSGRDGRVKSDDGQVDMAVVPPKAIGGSGSYDRKSFDRPGGLGVWSSCRTVGRYTRNAQIRCPGFD